MESPQWQALTAVMTLINLLTAHLHYKRFKHSDYLQKCLSKLQILGSFNCFPIRRDAVLSSLSLLSHTWNNNQTCQDFKAALG